MFRRVSFPPRTRGVLASCLSLFHPNWPRWRPSGRSSAKKPNAGCWRRLWSAWPRPPAPRTESRPSRDQAKSRRPPPLPGSAGCFDRCRRRRDDLSSGVVKFCCRKT
jgi:hypothetical protein